MKTLKTNRDLYIAISDLIKQHQESRLLLEEYLLAMLRVGEKFQEAQYLTLSEFHSILAESFTSKPFMYDPQWENEIKDLQVVEENFFGWRATIIQQIVNLHEMEEAGILQTPSRYFGIDSPRGARWYNFDPCTFIECAAAGSYGGWVEGDETDRDFVPGEVIVMTMDGKLESQDPKSIDDPIYNIDAVSWEAFQEFLFYGQHYE